MKALLVNPGFPKSYWGLEYSNRLTGRAALMPPLGLLTAAALLPRSWQLRLVDMNVAPLEDRALAWADVVLLTGMRIQSEAFHAVVRRAHALGKRVVAGGPYVTTDPDAAADVDVCVCGEAESTLPALARALERGVAVPSRVTGDRPDVGTSPVPRYDLLDVRRYTSIGVQFSRGCPFQCEFCDIIEMFGRRPRSKQPEQFIVELEAIAATGFRGAVFVVDDNFIGNKRAAGALLTRLAAWNQDHRHPFDFFTEASVNLADDDGLIAGMVAAGFSSVFLGIETPSHASLLAAGKRQNTHCELPAAVEKLTAAGLEVMAGFIVGFDTDEADIFERQHAFIASSPVPMAMVGMLLALPGTQLWRRLGREGRLRADTRGDNLDRPNFFTRLAEHDLVRGYTRLLERLYEPRAYFERALRALRLRPRMAPGHRRPFGFALRTALRSLWRQGVRGRYRWEYWRFLARALTEAPEHLTKAFAFAVVGEHMIRYTREDVLPRLRAALGEGLSGPALRPQSVGP